MNKTVEYFFTPISPWTYLGSERFQQIVKRHVATVKFRPCNLGAVFAETGGLPLPKRSPQRQANRLQELTRWSRYLDMPLTLKPKYFPANDQLASRMLIAAQRQQLDCGKLAHALHKITWVEEKDISDPETLKAAADAAGFDGAALLKAADAPGIAAEFERNTKEAMEKGVFGAPTYIVGDQLFWGQDRLDFVERELAK